MHKTLPYAHGLRARWLRGERNPAIRARIWSDVRETLLYRHRLKYEVARNDTSGFVRQGSLAYESETHPEKVKRSLLSHSAFEWLDGPSHAKAKAKNHPQALAWVMQLGKKVECWDIFSLACCFFGRSLDAHISTEKPPRG